MPSNPMRKPRPEPSPPDRQYRSSPWMRRLMCRIFGHKWGQSFNTMYCERGCADA